ncbi:hypothetical protein L3V82_07040 [Thiotrichales bacterium 19S3-7]|nr:hypothetical protein [Thiotrichales bacterium 19S3-7]MCF6801883.1 hypothetical protein [Thiotrichales bacterium 19S3-11]
MTREVTRKNAGIGQFGIVNQVRMTDEMGFRDGLYAQKNIKPSKLHLVNIAEETNRWNEFFRACKMDDLACAQAEDDTMYTPWIEGSEPSAEEVKLAVITLYNMDYFMADPKPDNFKKLADGRVIPVDFGQIFHRDSKKITEHSIALMHNAPFEYSRYFPDAREISEAYCSYQSERLDKVSAMDLHEAEHQSYFGFAEVPVLMAPPPGGFGRQLQLAREEALAQEQVKDEVPLLFVDDGKEKSSSCCWNPCVIL